MTHVTITLEGDDAQRIVDLLTRPQVISYGFDVGHVGPPAAKPIPVERTPAQRSERHKEYTVLQPRIRALLEEAVRMRASVDITYEDINGTFTRRDLHPTRVWKQTGPTGFRHWYVRGYCQAREEPRLFRVSRIKALEVR